MGQSRRAVAHKSACGGCAAPEPVGSVALQNISGDLLQRRAVSFVEATPGDELQGRSWSCSSGRRSRAGAAGKGTWLGAEGSVLPAGGGIWERLEKSIEKRFDLLHTGRVELVELGKASPDTVDLFVSVDEASGRVGESRLGLLGQRGAG